MYAESKEARNWKNSNFELMYVYVSMYVHTYVGSFCMYLGMYTHIAVTDGWQDWTNFLKLRYLSFGNFIEIMYLHLQIAHTFWGKKISYKM
jgi:hypothetical protein